MVIYVFCCFHQICKLSLWQWDELLHLYINSIVNL